MVFRWPRRRPEEKQEQEHGDKSEELLRSIRGLLEDFLEELRTKLERDEPAAVETAAPAEGAKVKVEPITEVAVGPGEWVKVGISIDPADTVVIEHTGTGVRIEFTPQAAYGLIGALVMAREAGAARVAFATRGERAAQAQLCAARRWS